MGSVSMEILCRLCSVAEFVSNSSQGHYAQTVSMNEMQKCAHSKHYLDYISSCLCGFIPSQKSTCSGITGYGISENTTLTFNPFSIYCSH